ncbi:hypothetical protein GTO91_04315 [Heliobacterium undosum]|uniref:Rloe protein n=1 Tax=Heliomicrobium undosum TaxID=121734 RepID=A0A845KZ36_9FIRM|nr:DUF6037 family protein [Heliomicrobium undosum]MZP28933.1 hypothetical protein [Heliomicrobium undosum]
MKLTGLVDLHKDMIKQQIKRYKFEFSFNRVVFDVFFFIDEEPYKLMFGVKAKNFYFELTVEKGFNINTFLGEKYAELCRVLNLNYDPSNSFSTNKFFEHFNNNIPKFANKNNYPKSHEIAIYKTNVEESEKKYFCGWRDNYVYKTNVTEKNLQKTKEYLGYDAFVSCQRKNISSCWTADENAAIDFYLP